MSETTKDEPLKAITMLESAAFRVGQLARRVRAEHGDAVELDAALVFSYQDGQVSPQLKLKARDVDGALAVAADLGVELESDGIRPGVLRPFQAVHGEADVDGITVEIRTLRYLSDDEAAQWRAEQDQADAEDARAGGGAG